MWGLFSFFCSFLEYPVHGFFHSYLGASILAVLVAGVVAVLVSPVGRIMTFFRIPQKSSFKKIMVSSLIGIYSHVFLDSFLYSDSCRSTRSKTIPSSTYFGR